MLHFFKSKPKGETVTFKIEGMHCSSCAMNIDGELEDTPGVINSTTSFAKATTTVTYDPEQVTQKQMFKAIETAGYKGSVLHQ